MCAKAFAVAPRSDPSAALLETEVVVVGRISPVRVALNVKISEAFDPTTVFPEIV